VSAGDVRYSYGPVPSRRLGKSLGINNIPAKVCTYSCIYCQIGRTVRMEVERRPFFEPQDIFKDVRERTVKAGEKGERIDYLTFVPDGEPTLDARLGEEIVLLKSLGIPVAVITNSSLLWSPGVRNELCNADWVSVKIDAVRESIWRTVNRPQRALKFSDILDGLLAFAGAFHGKLVTETMLVRGVNDSDGCVTETAGFIQRLHPHTAYLSIPTRPPAKKSARAPDEKTLNRAYHIVAEKTPRVEYLIGYEGNAFASTGDIARDILDICAVHPMREEAMREILGRSRSSWEIVEQLIAGGDLAESAYRGHRFYLRRFGKDSKAAPRSRRSGMQGDTKTRIRED
jgi:wyosine [tRNA(Phe)-imidazoG37] synthetase (radical SAM superfamily)